MHRSSSLLGLVALALASLAACSKTEGGASGAATATAVPNETNTIAITATPTASASASPVASASASPSASPSPSTSAKLAASAAAPSPAASASAATKSGTASALVATTGTAAANDLPPLKPASTRMSGKNFTLDAASPGCRVDVPCAVTLRLAASGEYHVNKEYPYKFTATGAPGVQFLGNGDANVFSRAAGDFRDEGEKAATLTVRFKPTASGEARVSGTYKMSVCSAENCQIEQQAVNLAVPVL
jgi:hypothetical protein